MKISNQNLISCTFLALALFIVGIEFFQELKDSGWVKSEFFLSVFLNILFFVILSAFFRNYLNSKSQIVKYSMSTAIVSALVFYWYSSLSYDPSFPTLAYLLLVISIYLIPGLLTIRGIALLIEKYLRK